MLPTLAILEGKCAALGLKVTQSGKRPAKADYVNALRAHFLPNDYPTGLPYEEIEPMLCFAAWNMKPADLRAAQLSKDWIAEWKENGARGVMHLVPQFGLFCHSRNISVKTWRRDEMHQQFMPILAERMMATFGTDPLVLDLELIIEKSVDTRPYTAKGAVTQTSLHSTTSVLALKPESARRLQQEQDAHFTFKILDVIRWGANDGRRATLRQRRMWRDCIMEEMAKDDYLARTFILPKEFLAGDKQQVFEDVVAQGGEGIILKNLNALYEDSSSRRQDAWVKMKKRIEFDAFVVGFERGDPGKGWENLVGDLLFAVHTEKGLHTIAKCSNMTMEMRQAITIYDPATNTVSLSPEMYGKVAEVSGQDVTPRSLRLSHATIDRWRDQPGDTKLSDDCKANMKELVQAAEWVG